MAVTSQVVCERGQRDLPSVVVSIVARVRFYVNVARGTDERRPYLRVSEFVCASEIVPVDERNRIGQRRRPRSIYTDRHCAGEQLRILSSMSNDETITQCAHLCESLFTACS